MYVRFEGAGGGGLFWIASDVELRLIRGLRMSRGERRRFHELHGWLRTHTPAPGEEAYRDWRSRLPRTWFRESAREHVRHAWLLSDLLSRRGVRVRPIRAREPGTIIWEDEVQVIVRPNRVGTVVRPRRPWARRRSWEGDRRTIRRW